MSSVGLSRRDRMVLLLALAVSMLPGIAAAGTATSAAAMRWGEVPVEALTATRGRIVLNAPWRFMPAQGAAARAPAGDWQCILVPGAWYRTGWSAPHLEGVYTAPNGPMVPPENLATVGRAWYEREIAVPADWEGRQIILRVDRVCTDAIVYVNDREVGQMRWPGGELDVTEFAQPGTTAKLRMLVVATTKEEQVEDLLAGRATEGSGESRGIVGDVILESRPAGPRIDGVFIQTSVREKKLTLDVDLAGLEGNGDVDFTAEVFDMDGARVKEFSGSASVSGDSEQTVRLKWPWPDPKLWDVGQPNLYRLVLTATGAGIEDEYAQRFGFREFRISGKEFLLNEKPIRFRPVVDKFIWYGVGMREALEKQMTSAMDAGFNLMEVWPSPEMRRGLALFRGMKATVADELGLPLMYPAMNLSYVIGRTGGKEEWDRWERLMVEEWRRMRNHPSALMLVCTANAFQHSDDQNPRRIGDLEALMAEVGEGRLEGRFAPGFKAMDIIRKYETTRPVTTHHGSAVGDFQTCNMYLNMLPLQEREEWLSAWAENSEAGPLMMVEFGTPWVATFHRGRENGSQARTTEPLLTEYAAIYLGPQAYRNETQQYRGLIKTRFAGEQSYEMWCTTGNPDYRYVPNHQALQALFIRHTWRSWRTWGLTGGMLPWAEGYGWAPRPQAPRISLPPYQPGRLGAYVTGNAFASGSDFRNAAAYYRGLDGMIETDAGRALTMNNGPALAWIAGPEGAFTAKDHHFFPGEVVSKQIVLINDSREELDWEMSCSAEGAGRQLYSWDDNGMIGVSETERIPFEFTAPDVDEKTTFKISLAGTIGRGSCTDSFEFRVYPRPKAPEGDSVLAFDPEGTTSGFLEALGFDLDEWEGEAAPGGVLVIGRNALSGGSPPPSSIESFVEGGGRAVIFGQDPDWLRSEAGFRVARHVSRRFFPVCSQSAHPVVAGLGADDFRDWRGSGSLVSTESNTELEKDFRDRRALAEGRKYGWHWGNRGSVSSAAIEKPHRSGWRPILEGEFDLAYSPLMELHYGEGIALWCTLDVEGRDDEDPVAEIVTSRLLRYAAEANVERRAPKTVALGLAEEEGILETLGMPHEQVDVLPAAPALVVIGPEKTPNEQTLAAFLHAGGRILFTPRPAGVLPLRYKVGTNGEFRSFPIVPGWPECRGLSESDLQIRSDVHVPILVSGPGQGSRDGLLGRLAHGEGVAVFTQLLPDMLNVEEETYLRFSKWRITRAVAQILSNLGAQFAADGAGLRRLTDPAASAPEYYCAGYITEFSIGDDPYRYKRW